jgi:ribose/xylose/arabinose/galactoside ABC-type transport system permease subunit
MLDSIVAAVTGGVALSGGRGSVLGGILGAFLLTVIFNIVLLLGFPVQLQLSSRASSSFSRWRSIA